MTVLFSPTLFGRVQDCKTVKHCPISWGLRFRDMTALLLSKLLTREDVGEAMQELLKWCWSTLAAADKTNAIGRYDMILALILQMKLNVLVPQV
jgi:hypothetical protein